MGSSNEVDPCHVDRKMMKDDERWLARSNPVPSRTLREPFENPWAHLEPSAQSSSPALEHPSPSKPQAVWDPWHHRIRLPPGSSEKKKTTLQPTPTTSAS